jgi:hypothetical protein
MVLHRRELLVKKQLLWVVFRLMPLDFMICTGMSGNGVKMFGTIIIMVRRLMVVLGKVVEIVYSGCCMAVPGGALRSIAVVPFVSGVRRTLAMMGTSVFA